MNTQVLTRQAVRWFAPASHDARCGSIFETQLGCLGIVWLKGRVKRTAFGHSSANSVQNALGLVDDATGVAWEEMPDDEVEPACRQLVERLQNFAVDFADDFRDVAIDVSGATEFQRRVLSACRRIRPGQTSTYRELAQRAGSPGSARAVGNVMASNQFAPIVPCHRVVGSGGGLGGYSAPAGLALKRRLLAAEARPGVE